MLSHRQTHGQNGTSRHTAARFRSPAPRGLHVSVRPSFTLESGIPACCPAARVWCPRCGFVCTERFCGLIIGQRHLRSVLAEYVEHCNTGRAHWALNLHAPATWHPAIASRSMSNPTRRTGPSWESLIQSARLGRSSMWPADFGLWRCFTYSAGSPLRATIMSESSWTSRGKGVDALISWRVKPRNRSCQ